MEQINLDNVFNKYEIGEDWQRPYPTNKALYEYEMSQLRSELIRNVEFNQFVGQGYLGKVYEVLAQHRNCAKQEWSETKSQFACKVIRHRTRTTLVFEESFNEKTILQHLSHKNICNFIELIGISDRRTCFPYSVVCLFFEFCDGTLQNIIDQDLTQQLRHQGDSQIISEELNQHWFEQIARALDYIHTNRIVHLDIKSENILYICRTTLDSYKNHFLASTFKLADFGVARTYSHASSSAGFEQDKLVDIHHLYQVLFKHAIANRPTICQDNHIHSDLLDYCETDTWKTGYPEQWKMLSSELKDMLSLMAKSESLANQQCVTIHQILNHFWLQKRK